MRVQWRRSMRAEPAPGVPTRGALLLLVALAIAGSGCALVAGSAPPRRLPAATGVASVGAARIDITPVPGFPMGGHSIEGQVSRGVWLRLHARALYLESPEGVGLALVAADLWSMPAGLVSRVVDLLAEPARVARMDGRVLGREQLVLSASHTHQSPGLYSSDPFFSAFAAPAAGFDPDLHDFLAQRISEAIVRAVEARAPAALSFASDRVSGVMRNRSIEPFRANPEAQAVLEESAGSPCAPEPLFPDPDSCRAVDDRLRVIAARSADGELLAAAVFLAVHPEAMSHDLGVYSADVFGAAATRLERQLGDGGAGPVVALFNGPEGDVSLQFGEQTRADLLRLTDTLAARIAALLDGPGEAMSGELRLQFSGRRRLWLQPVGGPQRGLTALMPMPGRATGAGAEDGPSDAPTWLAREGMAGVPLPLHGHKMGQADLLSVFGLTVPPFWITRLFTFFVPPPVSASVGVYRVGDVVLATLPGEFTTVLGRRIASQVAASAGVPFERVALLGLTGGYAYYFATPEEYALQHYEGSGTLYGPLSGAHVGREIGRLAARLDEDVDAARHGYLHVPWLAGWMQPRRTARQKVEAPPERVDAQLRLLLGPTAADAEGIVPPRTCWTRAELRLPADPLAERVVPAVGIEVHEGRWKPLVVAGRRQDDGGTTIATVAGPDGDGERWCSYWMVPRGTDPEGRYRFRVRSEEGVSLCAPIALDPAAAVSGSRGSPAPPSRCSAPGPASPTPRPTRRPRPS